ncbi:MAG: ABC transporter substrate-binding protein, partial [Candidatus Methylumidiphilus sp.]
MKRKIFWGVFVTAFIALIAFIAIWRYDISRRGISDMDASITVPSYIEKQQILRIAAVLPLTGPAAQIGTWQKNGIELALTHINSELSKDHKTIQVEYEDSSGDSKTGVSALQRLLALNKMIAVLSSLSNVSNAILPITSRVSLPTVLLSVSYPTITDDNPWAVRCHLGSEEEAQAMVNYLLTTNIKNFSLAYVNDDFGVGAAQSLKEFAISNKLQISIMEPYEKTATDLRVLASKLIRDQPRAIYVVGYVKSSVLLIKQLREL